MILDDSHYATTTAFDLLDAAARGHVPMDHRLLEALSANPANTCGDLALFASAVLEDREDHIIDMTDDVVSLVRHFKAAEGIPFLVNVIESRPEDIPDEVVECVCELGEPAIGPLLELRDRVDPAFRAEIVFLLAGLRVDDPRILDALRELAEEDLEDALVGFGLHADPKAIGILREIQAANPSADGIEQTIAALENPLPADIEPYDIWAQYPDTTLPWFEILSEDERGAFLSSPTPAYRAAAAGSFVADEYGESVRNLLLQLAHKDPELAVRANCWEALGGSLGQPGMREALLAKAADTESPIEERKAALLGVAAARDDEVRAWIRKFYKDPETRAAALQAMWRSLDTEFADHLRQHLDDPDPELKRHAVLGVGYLALADEADKLPPLFLDPELRSDALFSFSMSKDCDLSPEAVVRLLEEMDLLSGGLSEDEAELIQDALDDRLELNGKPPLFHDHDEEPES